RSNRVRTKARTSSSLKPPPMTVQNSHNGASRRSRKRAITAGEVPPPMPAALRKLPASTFTRTNSATARRLPRGKAPYKARGPNPRSARRSPLARNRGQTTPTMTAVLRQTKPMGQDDRDRQRQGDALHAGGSAVPGRTGGRIAVRLSLRLLLGRR